ncbi:MAG: 30S ribosomal protein S20 [Ruthenibacterium lactatiformans]
MWCRRKRGSAQQSDQVNLKTVVKKADAAISAGAADKDAAVKAAVVAIDKAAAKGVLHRTRLPQGFRLAKAADKAGK